MKAPSFPELSSGLSLVEELPFLLPSECNLLSRMQARTHARLSRPIERFFGHWATLSAEAREAVVDGFIDLLGAVDSLLQAQAAVDADAFLGQLPLPLHEANADFVRTTVLKAYRWQHIVSRTSEPRFRSLLGEPTTPAQRRRVEAAVARLTYARPISPLAFRLAA